MSDPRSEIEFLTPITCVKGADIGFKVRDEGVPLPTRSTLNFAGAGVFASDDAANDWTNVSIPGGGGGTINPVFIAQAVVVNKSADVTWPQYTWYAPNWAFSGGGNVIYKNTLGVTFTNVIGTNDGINLATSGWYRLEACWGTILNDTDTTPPNEHWLMFSLSSGFPKPGTGPWRSWSSERRKTSSDRSPNPTISYKDVFVGTSGTFKYSGGWATVNLRSILTNFDNVINNGQMIYCSIMIEQLPFTVGPP